MDSNFLKNKITEYIISRLDDSDINITSIQKEKIAQFICENIMNQKLDIDKIDESSISKIRQNSDFFAFLIGKISLFYLLQIKKEKIEEYKEIIKHLETFVHKFEELINIVTWKDNSMVIFENDNFLYSSNNIIDTFEKIKEDAESIVFMNLYKGVPIRSKATIIDINENRVAFKVEDELQEIAMKLDGKAFILTNDYFSKYIKADIAYINFLDNSVVLENFIYLLNMPAAERAYVRVYPDILAKVMLNSENEVLIEGKLFDLSENGLGVVSEEHGSLQNGTKVDISFNLNDDENIKVSGKIMNIIEYDNSYRYCIKISPTDINKEKITAYVKKRENDTILELRNELKNFI